MTGFDFGVGRCLTLTDILGIGATGMEPAALGRIGRRRNITLQLDPFHLHCGIRIGNRREQCLCIRMQGIAENILLGAELHHGT